MTLDQLIEVAKFVLPCAVALLVGYWHRKQMRQLELHRLDPSVGVLPPPSPPVAFFKRYWVLIVGIGMPMLPLALLIGTNNPVTNGSAALISLNVACILVTLHFHFQLYSEVRLLKLLEKHVTVTENVFRTVEAHSGHLGAHDRQTEALAARIAELEKQAKDGSSRIEVAILPSEMPPTPTFGR